MTDLFTTFSPSLEMPAQSAFAITPTDDSDLPFVTRGLHVNTGGSITVIFVNDTEEVALSVADNTTYPYRLKKVLGVGTDHDVDLVGLY
jgi:ribosomal protein S4E